MTFFLLCDLCIARSASDNLALPWLFQPNGQTYVDNVFLNPVKSVSNEFRWADNKGEDEDEDEDEEDDYLDNDDVVVDVDEG